MLIDSVLHSKDEKGSKKMNKSLTQFVTSVKHEMKPEQKHVRCLLKSGRARIRHVITCV